MELPKYDYEAYEEEDANQKKMIADQMQGKIEALKQEVAGKKELLVKKIRLAEEREEQLKTFQHERIQVKEKAESRKRELEKKMEEIRKKNEQMMQQNGDAQEARNKREKKIKEKEEEKKKEILSNGTTPVISEELQAQYQEQIAELNHKLDGTKLEISIIVSKNKNIERQIEEAKDKGEDITNHKEEYLQQILNLRENLVEMSKERNRLLKEKEALEEQLKLSKMADHSEKGNSMIAEIEDGNKIMSRNLKIVNQKCCEVKKRIALKQFELDKLKESYSNLLYDLKKKNNHSNSAYGVVQGEIDEYKQKIRALESKMETIAHMEETVPFPVSDDNFMCLNNMFMSKEKTFREAVKECQDVAKKTFSKREALFHLECEFRKRKTELRDWQNKIVRRKEELQCAIEENEKNINAGITSIEEEIHVEQIWQKSNLHEQQTGHEENQSSKTTSEFENLEKGSSSKNSDVVLKNDNVEANACKHAEIEDPSLESNLTRQELSSNNDLEIENSSEQNGIKEELNSSISKDIDFGNSLEHEESDIKEEFNSSISPEHELGSKDIDFGNGLDAKSINTSSNLNFNENSGNEIETSNSHPLDKGNSSDEKIASDLVEKASNVSLNLSIEGKLANMENFDEGNDRGALNNVNTSIIGNESTFLDENIAMKFKNVNCSIRKGNSAFMNSNCSFGDESSFDESNFISDSINKEYNLANELMFAEQGNLVNELIFADKENRDNNFE